MTHKFLSRLLIVLVAAGALAACEAQAPASWPGLATDGKLAYVANNDQVHAISLVDGKQVWAFPPSPNPSVTGIFYADPGLSPTMIVVGSEGPTASHSGVLFGLNPETGQQQWCLAFDSRGAQRQNCPLASGGVAPGIFGIEPPSDNRILGGIIIADDTAYFGLANSQVYAVDLATGKDQWFFKAEHAVWAAPRVEGDFVYVTSLDHWVYALDRADGSLVWKKDLGAAVGGTPAVVDDNLYIGSFGSKLYALDAATGQDKWSEPFEANNWVWGGPVFQADTLYFTDLAGTVFAVDAESGRQAWAVTPGTVMRGSPAVTADTLFIGDKAGMLFALNLADGSVNWKQQLSKGQLLASPVVVNNLVLVTPYQGDNLLVAYEAASGALKWAFAPSKR